MTFDDVYQYLDPAIMRLYGRSTMETANKLDKALGVDWYENYRSNLFKDETPLSDEAKALYRQLAGPYGHIVLKAYRIKKGLENDSAAEPASVGQSRR